MLADVQVGETVKGLAVFDASPLLVVNGDGVTFLRLRAPWTNGIDLVRSSRTIGHRSVSMEDYPFTLGNTGIDDDRVPASPPGSPAAETLTGMITDGVGGRSGPTARAFDVNDPPLNHEQHAMVVEFSLESMTKVTCENRLPWVDFGWRWPRYAVTCAVSQRKP